MRWAQINALMGMMQISIAPWRVLSKENVERVLAALKLHEKFGDGDTFLKLAKNAAGTGEPVVRHMAYVFPGEGFETAGVQFMLGNDIMAAPVLEKRAKNKSVKFPSGI